jgi:hypothetical protein
MKSYLTALCLILGGWSATTQAAPSEQPAAVNMQPFQATYKVRVGNIPAGEVKVSLELTRDGGYRYSQHSVPQGLAAFLTSTEIKEVSEGRIEGQQVIPTRYNYKREKANKKKRVSLSFDWTAGKVTDHAADPKWSLKVPAGTQDKFSKQLAMVFAMNAEPRDVSFPVADRGRIKTYHFRPKGRETVKIGKKSYSTLRVDRSKNNKPTSGTLWVAPKLHYLPVKVEKPERGNTFVMELVSVRWLQPEAKLAAN